MDKNYILISDIHGCFDELQQLWNKVNFNPDEDIAVFMGDMIDRGKDSYKVVSFVKNLQKQYGKESVIALTGNHEILCVNHLQSPAQYQYEHTSLFYMNGGKTTEDSYKREGHSLMEDLEYFKSLPLMVETDNFIIVHAGINPYKSMDNQSIDDMVWIREIFHSAPKCLFKKPVLFGHSITGYHFNNDFDVALLENGNVCIDTGCIAGGYLTAVKINGNEIVDIIKVNGVGRK